MNQQFQNHFFATFFPTLSFFSANILAYLDYLVYDISDFSSTTVELPL
jgi:hypothetical protein